MPIPKGHTVQVYKANMLMNSHNIVLLDLHSYGLIFLLGGLGETLGGFGLGKAKPAPLGCSCLCCC